MLMLVLSAVGYVAAWGLCALLWRGRRRAESLNSLLIERLIDSGSQGRKVVARLNDEIRRLGHVAQVKELSLTGRVSLLEAIRDEQRKTIEEQRSMLKELAEERETWRTHSIKLEEKLARLQKAVDLAHGEIDSLHNQRGNWRNYVADVRRACEKHGLDYNSFLASGVIGLGTDTEPEEAKPKDFHDVLVDFFSGDAK